MKQKLPIGIQTFREIREEGYYFLDTLKELFEGSEELFRGLAIHGDWDWDWSVRYPVVRLGFGSGNFKEPGSVCTSLMAQLDTAEQEASVEPRYDTAPERFGHPIRTLHERTGQPVSTDVDEMATEALLFQTGYLTIRAVEKRGDSTYYRLGYPNREVRLSMNRCLLAEGDTIPAEFSSESRSLVGFEAEQVSS